MQLNKFLTITLIAQQNYQFNKLVNEQIIFAERQKFKTKISTGYAHSNSLSYSRGINHSIWLLV